MVRPTHAEQFKHSEVKRTAVGLSEFPRRAYGILCQFLRAFWIMAFHEFFFHHWLRVALGQFLQSVVQFLGDSFSDVAWVGKPSAVLIIILFLIVIVCRS
jgi:hypothetical protein